jgi:hypothetical protein
MAGQCLLYKFLQSTPDTVHPWPEQLHDKLLVMKRRRRRRWVVGSFREGVNARARKLRSWKKRIGKGSMQWW